MDGLHPNLIPARVVIPRHFHSKIIMKELKIILCYCQAGEAPTQLNPFRMKANAKGFCLTLYFPYIKFTQIKTF